MKQKLILSISFLLAMFYAYPQWGPIPALTGASAPALWCSGQDIIAQGSGAQSLYYSQDFGNTWQLKPLNYYYAMMLWNGNLIHTDSVQDIVMDNNISGNDVFLSSFFRGSGLLVEDIQYSNGRFFALTDTATAVNSFYYSDDSCVTWQKINLIPESYPAYALFRATRGFIYVVTIDTLYASTDNGNTWKGTQLFLNGNPATAIDAYDSVVAFENEVYVTYSTNAGNTCSVDYSHDYTYATGIAVSDSGIYVGSSDYPRGVFRFNPLTQIFDTINITALADSSVSGVYNDDGKILISTNSEGIYWLDEASNVINNFATQLYAQRIVGFSLNNNQSLTLNSWTYSDLGEGTRQQMTYSSDFGNTFNKRFIDYNGIHAQMLADTTPYFLVNENFVNSTGIQLYKLSGNQPVLVSSDSFFYGPEAIFSMNDSDFFVINFAYSGYFVVYHSADAGVNWTVSDSMWDFEAVFDYRIANDSVFLLCGDDIHVYDLHGNLAYQVPVYVSENSYYYPRRLWVTDTSFIISNTTSVFRMDRTGDGSSETIASSFDFDGSTILTSGLYAGYVLMSVDSQGVFVLPPGSTNWVSFSQGLPYLYPGSFYFSDSMIYGIMINSDWLWQRKLSDLVNPQATDLQLTVTGQSPPCNGGTGSAIVSATGGTGTYDYVWSNNITAASINGLRTGKYYVTATSFNVSAVDSVTITVPLPVTDALNTVAFNCDSAAVHVLVTGGTPPYSYSWSTGGTDSLTTVQVNQEYGLTIQDANSCALTDTGTFICVSGIYAVSDAGVNMHIYPNPATGSFTLEASGIPNNGESMLQIFDIAGRLLQTQPVTTGKTNIDVSALPDGLYTIFLKSTGTITSEKLIIIR